MEPTAYTITKHAKTRYAERIMKKDNAWDINKFVQENEAKIIDDLMTMIEYSVEVYTGKPIVDNPKNHTTTYYLSGNWVLVCDQQDKKVITLYKIELGLGDDLNKEYVARYMEKISQAKMDAEELSKQIEKESLDYKAIVENNNLIINEYRSKIKALEEVNIGYTTLIKASADRKKLAESAVQTLVANLVGRKEF